MEEGEELSLLDLIEYYEGGPVIRERTPDVNRVVFGPDESIFTNKAEGEPGKKSTSKQRLNTLYKEALGLLDVPGGATDGHLGFRERDSYDIDGQDAEAGHKGGFGGPSIIDVEEDKHPINIDRKKKDNDFSSKDFDFFDFLMSLSNNKDYDLIKKDYYVADNGKIWLKKSTGSIYFSKFSNSNNIILINVKEGLSKAQKIMLEKRINMDNLISNAKKEVYKEIISDIRTME